MSLDTEEHVRQTWGSHMPFLQAVMEILRPELVVECGCGAYSTPIIEQFAAWILTIEHDANWANKVIKTIANHPDHHWLVHALNNAHNGTRRPDMRPQDLKDVDDWYANLDMNPFDFLFVDTYTCARVPAMIYLSKYARMVMLHDLEKNSPEFYNFELIDDAMDGWHRYRFAPVGKVNKIHAVPWTDLFTKDEIELEELQPVVDKAAQSLWGFSTTLTNITGEGWGNHD